MKIWCDSCNKNDKIRVKRNEENIDFTWLDNMPISMETVAQTLFSLSPEYGLLSMVFIINLEMIKLQKYAYILNILYRTTRVSPLYPQPIILSPNKENMLESCLS